MTSRSLTIRYAGHFRRSGLWVRADAPRALISLFESLPGVRIALLAIEPTLLPVFSFFAMLVGLAFILVMISLECGQMQKKTVIN